MNYTTAYSGDLTSSLSRAKKHTLTKVGNVADRFSVVKLCPGVTGSSTVSLTADENFDFQTNTTGQFIFYNVAKQVWFWLKTILKKGCLKIFILKKHAIQNHNFFLGMQGLYYRDADVLTDADCVKDNKDGPTQKLIVYQPPDMTCTQYDGTHGLVNVSEKNLIKRRCSSTVIDFRNFHSNALYLRF